MYSSGNYGKNEWVGSVMQTYLNDNGDYYKRIGTASNYGLKENAKTIISDAKYYLGGATYNNGFGNADTIYLWERGNNTFNYENYCLYNTWNTTKCASDYCENNQNDEICNATRSKFWVGEVALMYPSDEYLVYANGVDAACYANPNDCFYDIYSGKYGIPTTGWIFNSNNLEGQNSEIANWFMSPYSNESARAINVQAGGFVDNGTGFTSEDYLATRPVLYLSSNVKITDGTGESTNPYKLGL